MRLRIAFCLISILTPALSISAQGPVVRAVRVDKGPAVDGRLDDEVWSRAVPFGGFRMVFPYPESDPTERTELRVLYDEDNLYIGVVCFDGEPSKIAANSMAHDADEGYHGGGSEDVVRVLLDPFQDKRNAYIFFVSARGARSEGLAFGEHYSLNWDGIWDARSRIGEDGWSAEMRIPFKTISFKPGLASWGLNVERYIPRKQETIRLSGVRRDSLFYNAVEAVPLEGIADIRQGKGITFRPYGKAGAYKDHARGLSTDLSLDGGFDIYKNFTPNFVGAFSCNMDFAETEVDERRINLTRFPLYFPEKRTFFLEGSEIFNFGTTDEESFVPFFSRRIGLFEGRPVPVVFGTKLFGKLGETNLTVLDVRTEAMNGLPAENFLAARVSRNIFEQSKVGFILTNGSPTGARNTLAGFDLVFKTSRFQGDRNFGVGGWYVHNWNAIKSGHHNGFGFKIDYPNDLWDIAATYSYFGYALNPGLGFLARPGVQSFSLGFDYQPRPEKGFVGRLVRQFFYQLQFSFVWDLAGRLETRRVFLAPLNLTTESGERVEFNIMPNRDVLPFDFEVADGVVLPRGAYDFTNYRAELSTASYRPWSSGLRWHFGPWYSGSYHDAELELSFKLKGTATLGFNANVVRGRLPQGNFDQNVYQLKADFFLSPDLGLMSYIQYDDVSRLLGASLRFRWRIAPGNEIYVVYNKNWERRWNPLSRFAPLEERGVFKITLSVRP